AVAKYRIDSLAALARQMTFAPAETRLAQLAAAEDLLHTIDPAKAYPPDFIVFRITGYHPQDLPVGVQFTGLALQHDLGQLIERVSETLDVRTTSLREPVLSIDDVTEKFNVTSKTIQRWRRKGLAARRFVFPDGKRRVGFLLGSVERFLAKNREHVQAAANFSQVDEREREEILRRARRLATQCHCCQHEIARRIARKLGRSPLTVQHTIRKHDEERPQAAIFPLAPPEPTEAERTRILRGYRRGLSLRRLARRTCRTRSTVYRVIVDEKIAKVTAQKVKFIDDPLYHQEGAAAAVDAIAAQPEPLAALRAKADESARVPRDLPPYLQDLYRTPLLSPARERALFLKFNYHKYRFVALRRKLDPQFARTRELSLLEGHLRRATRVKNDIVQANLRLVVSVARKHLRPGLSLMELVSEGNVTLLRAVEGFDFHKGNKFSTYATFALMKGFARSVPQLLAARLGGGGDADRLLHALPDPRAVALSDRMSVRDEVGRLLASLTDRERDVLSARFGLGQPEAPDAPTFEQLGKRLGLPPTKVRQIEQAALQKLRTVAVG
ncbi:MAG TPA: sigma factor, partial [Tepidisphaeraceae bacterium]|nr:sigma factor [Tepidisphaeraceae bacterium]